MTDMGIGDQLNKTVSYSKGLLYDQGEMAQLTFLALNHASNEINKSEELNEIEIDVPIGYRPDKQPILAKKKFNKEELVRKYTYLANNQLSINGVYQLVTIIEAMLNDILFIILTKYPKKISSKKTVTISAVLSVKSFEELYVNTIYSLLNELTYKSPREYSEGFECYTSIKLLECAAFHKYIELKATRDVLIHNRGVANEIYETKAGTHARVRRSNVIPVDTIYFMESYESCLQFVEWLEINIHEIWHSSEYEKRISTQQAASEDS